MDEPGYSEYPSWVWVQHLGLGLAIVAAGVLVVLAVLRYRGWARVAIIAAGLAAVVGLSWQALSPVMVDFRGTELTCSPSDAMLRGNPDDSTLNPAARACRTGARRSVALDFTGAAVVGGAAIMAGRRRPHES